MGKCYLITGAAGYVGKRLVEMLCQHNVDNVTKVKLLDLKISPEDKKTQEKLGKDSKIDIEWIIADITSQESVNQAVQEVDVVIHTASIINIYDDIPEEFVFDVNVQGTKNMIEACCLANVQYFIYTSSSEAVGPNVYGHPMDEGDENTPYLFKATTLYAKSKHAAENSVLLANGRKLKNGKILTTCSLRPGAIYGGNNRFEKRQFLLSRRSKTLFSLTEITAVHSSIHLDNLVWSHILAAKHIQTKSTLVGGNAYFLGDNTPHLSYSRLSFMFYEPFGFTISREPLLPYWMLLLIAYIFVAIHSLLSFLKIKKQPLFTPGLLNLQSAPFTFSHKKFEKHFEYQPLLSWKECLKMARNDIKKWIEECE